MFAIRRVRDHLDRHYAEPITLATLTDISGTIVHPNQPELEITLMVPGPPLASEAAAFVRSQLEAGQMGGLGLRVDDCRKTAAELARAGVAILQEPTDRPYGVEAVIRDNTGNWLTLVEPKAFTQDDLKGF